MLVDSCQLSVGEGLSYVIFDVPIMVNIRKLFCIFAEGQRVLEFDIKYDISIIYNCLRGILRRVVKTNILFLTVCQYKVRFISYVFDMYCRGICQVSLMTEV